MSLSKNELAKLILNNSDVKTAEDIENTLKDLLGGILNKMLEAELDEHLGYTKYDYQNKNTPNSRNGKSSKTIKSNLGVFDLDVPRDRQGSFEPGISKETSNRCITFRKCGNRNVCKGYDYTRYSNLN